jgi:hypothetical protein
MYCRSERWFGGVTALRLTCSALTCRPGNEACDCGRNLPSKPSILGWCKSFMNGVKQVVPADLLANVQNVNQSVGRCRADCRNVLVSVKNLAQLADGLAEYARWQGQGFCYDSSANQLSLSLYKWLAPTPSLESLTSQELADDLFGTDHTELLSTAPSYLWSDIGRTLCSN